MPDIARATPRRPLSPGRRGRRLPARWAVVVAMVLAMVPPLAGTARAGDLIGQMQTRTTVYNDTLLDLAHQSDLGLIELMAANPGVDPWLPGADRSLVMPNQNILPDAPRKGIVVNTAELRLYYFGDPKNPKSFPIGVGREGYLTPHGTTTVVRKKEKPSWYLTPSEIADNPDLPRVIPPGPDNPLGSHALYLGWPTYLIHGTNTPWGVGRRVSRGCIRMYEEDVAWLFQHVQPGTPVNVVDQPVKLGRQAGELYIEVQPSAKQVAVMEETSKSPGPAEPLPVHEWADRILAFAGADIDRLDWPAIEKALADRQGFPVQISRTGVAPAATASVPMAPAATTAATATAAAATVGAATVGAAAVGAAAVGAAAIAAKEPAAKPPAAAVPAAVPTAAASATKPAATTAPPPAAAANTATKPAAAATAAKPAAAATAKPATRAAATAKPSTPTAGKTAAGTATRTAATRTTAVAKPAAASKPAIMEAMRGPAIGAPVPRREPR